jgi:lysophospholipase L1-like esterase
LADVGDDLPQRRPATAIGELFTRYLRPRIFHSAAHRDAGDSIVANANSTIRANLADLDSIEKLAIGAGARFSIVYAPFRRDVPKQSANAQSILRAWANAHRVPLLDMTSVELPYSSGEITMDGLHFNARGHWIVAQAIERAWPTVAGNPDLSAANRPQ